MSRYDGRLDAAAQVPIDAAGVPAAFDALADPRSRERQDAIACFLSGSEGWEHALALLGGAFAADALGERHEGKPVGKG